MTAAQYQMHKMPPDEFSKMLDLLDRHRDRQTTALAEPVLVMRGPVGVHADVLNRVRANVSTGGLRVQGHHRSVMFSPIDCSRAEATTRAVAAASCAATPTDL